MINKKLNYEMKQIQADALTPISIYEALEGRKKVLFESNAKHDESGRYSFIALDPIMNIQGNDKQTVIQKYNGTKETLDESVLDVLNNRLPKVDDCLPFSFFGGAIGHFSYETAYHHEKIGNTLKDDLNIPDVNVYLYEKFIVVDHIFQTATIVHIDLLQSGYTNAWMQQQINLVEQQITINNRYTQAQLITLQFTPSMEKEQFLSIVETAKEHIRKGDIFQVVLSQRFEAPFKENPFHLYRTLRTSNASPYMFYLDFDEYQILGTSPESLVKIQSGIVTTNPIAGTKKRGLTKLEDEKIANALLQDEKELAEHKMLVDLGRNDIGRVSELGTVQVTKYMKIERYKHVMHIVSEVNGHLKHGYNAIDVIKACLPAGTVSGAPKIRAMQIIHSLEQQRRNIYAGAIGYISCNGNMDLALAIRTMVVKDEKAIVQAGAGVVYDSIAESEYEETWNKAKALLEVNYDIINR